MKDYLEKQDIFSNSAYLVADGDYKSEKIYRQPISIT